MGNKINLISNMILIKSIIFSLIFLSYGLHAQDLSYECLNAQKERNIAIEVQDWEAILRTSDRTTKACKEKFTPKKIFTISLDRLPALYNFKKYDEVLKESNRCIEMFFNEPVCHYWRAVIFVHKKQFTEARKAADLGRRICKAVILKGEASLLNAVGSEDRLDIESDIAVAKIVLNNIDKAFEGGR